jgi:hypothetical protein
MSGVAGKSDHTYIRNVNTTTVSGGSADFVTVDVTTGLLGHLSSSRRYKEEIKSMDNASQALFALKNEEQEATIARQQKQIDALAEGLQKVSAQLEVSKPATRTVNNNQ